MKFELPDGTRAGSGPSRSGLGLFRWSAAAAVASILLLLISCGGRVPSGSTERPEPPSSPPVQGVYQGALEVDGLTMEVTVWLERAGSEVTGRVESDDDDFRAAGSGRLVGDDFRLHLTYGDDCEGELLLDGYSTADGAVLRGELVAEDCTGGGAGLFTLERIAESDRKTGAVGPPWPSLPR